MDVQDIQKRVEKRKNRIERVSEISKEDPLLVEKILDKAELIRRASSVEEIKDYLKVLEVACGKDQYMYYANRVNEFFKERSIHVLVSFP